MCCGAGAIDKGEVKMKGSFLLNMLAILAGLLGIMVLSGVSLSDSGSLYRLLAAGLLFFGSWQLFVRGFAQPVAHSGRQVQAPSGRENTPARRAA